MFAFGRSQCAWEYEGLHPGILSGNKPILNTASEAFNTLYFSFMLSALQLINPPQDTSEAHKNVHARLKFERMHVSQHPWQRTFFSQLY